MPHDCYNAKVQRWWYQWNTQQYTTQAIERMKEEVHQEHPEKQLTVEYMQLDLASFQSTKDFTIAFKEKNLPLHLLINNAGVAWVPYSEFLPFVL